MISKDHLITLAKKNNYRPEILEKVFRLLQILQQFLEVPYLRNRLVLKGGTALNLFHFESLPRLSVDIDLNYIGHINRLTMLDEKPIINDALYKILEQNQYEFYRHPNNHAGSKMIWRYSSVLGQKGNLEIDLNYMYRQPLWEAEWKEPKLTLENSFEVPVLNIHELAAGKLAALFSRTESRDLFDAHYLLNKIKLNTEKLRQAFVIYMAMTDIDLDFLHPNSILGDVNNLHNRLLPLLKKGDLPNKKSEIQQWLKMTLTELKDGLKMILPLRNNEKAFISQIRENEIIDPTLLDADEQLASIIKSHPALLWASKRNE